VKDSRSEKDKYHLVVKTSLLLQRRQNIFLSSRSLLTTLECEITIETKVIFGICFYSPCREKGLSTSSIGYRTTLEQRQLV